MNWHKRAKIIFSIAAVSLLLLQVLEAIAHSGHQHEPEQKSVGEPPSEMMPVAPEQSESTPAVSEVEPPSSSDGVAPVSKVKPSNSTPLSWLPQPGEWLLLLLVTGPFGLVYLKYLLSDRK